ncbi:MAG: SPW repeat domain-containing protein [Gammaproteobacteria bacterium]
MKFINPTVHGYLDYATVVLFFLAPNLFGLSGQPAMIAYALAVIHLAVTLTTDFPSGVVRVIPFPVHGWIERIVGPVLVVLPFVMSFTGAARNFYILVGIVIVLVGAFTDYEGVSRPASSQVQ